jgi:hypothetical protein
MLIRSIADSASTSVQGPLILLLMQQKCGGYNWLSLLEMPQLIVPGRDIQGLVLFFLLNGSSQLHHCSIAVLLARLKQNASTV